MYELSEDYDKMFNGARNRLAEYCEQNNIESLVVGISGGIDSAVVAAIASTIDVKLIGRFIHIDSNELNEKLRADEIGKAFCNDYLSMDMDKAYRLLATSGMENCSCYDSIPLGNIKARLRMIQLYHLAYVNKGMVLSTDNFTEYLLGFWTLHGDVGDFGMIQNLWKTEVYGLAKWIVDGYLNSRTLLPKHFDQAIYAMNICIDATPTDGLGVSESDYEQLGCDSYQEVDEILLGYLNTNTSTDHPVVERHVRSGFKRFNPLNIKRKDLV